MNKPKTLLDVIDLSLSFRHENTWLQVLYDVSFSICEGEALGLVGESGCGKSSLAYLTLGYRHPSSRILHGQVRFDGKELLGLSRESLDQLRGRAISFVPQDPTSALSPSMRVGEQVAEVLGIHGVITPKQTVRDRVAELFEDVGLPNPTLTADRYPHELSGGQQQRVIIAMALACDPKMVVLDEPTTGLDVTTQEQIVSLLHDLRVSRNMSMLYVSHDLGVLGQITDRVAVMYAGHIVEVGPTATIFEKSYHPYTDGLIASIPTFEATDRIVEPALKGLLNRNILPNGCAFYPRCDYAKSFCESNPQLLQKASEDHLVACERWGQFVGVSGSPTEQVSTSVQKTIKKTSLLNLDNVSLGYSKSGPDLFSRLSKSVPVPVVNNVSLEVSLGQTFALVGESGSGKSTIARAIGGLISPILGGMTFQENTLAGLVQKRPKEIKRKIQYIFQNPDASLNPRSRISNILSRPLEKFFGFNQETIRQKVSEVLYDVRLDDSYSSRYPDQLSGGERQRIAIARALICDPELLLCDEILSALDVSVQANIINLLQVLRIDKNVAMLFISHDLAVVRSLADKVGVLFDGGLVEAGDVEEIFSPPFHPYTHSLLMAVPSVRNKYALPPKTIVANQAANNSKGCSFAGRCPWQLGTICEKEIPPVQRSGTTLTIHCHVPIDRLTDLTIWQPPTSTTL